MSTRRGRLHWWIVGGMVAGAAAGAAAHFAWDPETVTDTAIWRGFDGVARVFLNLLKMIVLPLVFFTLIGGLIGIGDVTRLGRLGIKTFGMYVLTSLLAIVTGLTLVNLVRPGAGVRLEMPTTAVEDEVPGSFWDVLVTMVPDNPVAAAAEFDLLGVILFALLFGAALLTLSGDRRRVMETFVNAGGDVMMRMTGWIIALAPIGVGALIARMVATTGLGVFYELRWYVITVAAALAIHLLGTLPLLVYLLTRRSPYRYLMTMSSALMTGFSTASSSGTLPVTIERAERGAGVSNRVASFVLPIGATVNMDGTALYEIVSVLFIAQVHAAVDPNFTLTVGQQLLIVFLGLMVSIGAAGIPHAGLVMMVIILQAVGLPIEYTGLIWAVDRVLDMSRTMVNIASDSSIALIVAHGEGEIDEAVLSSGRAA